ncbi:hypothetical protein ACSSV8_003118 [Roseovarius sp. MBR-79]|jgi:hypothetical protein|uniref:Uncharacterized protein n=4 Tax=Rhodobacterales TaxID=204455 RepID=A3VJC7_9RHOB|nr:hypothetical protein PhaeoP51_03929 [Phaeobacter inhibens]EAQ11734.1 hypothetical protein RB2654_22643 [Rhodobacterales bacterium HTCC2654] [Maritimibacter alkaliphilus HTCC2654]KUP94062.1 hypothetical protein TRIHO_10870 [Tritonibacter horizontis]UOA17075.1 hypothetical protein DSM109990_03974 [Sulfitobacter dubius]CUH51784.1 hypothetical protein SHM7688_01223 [Shimia marina]|tara:strand:+ start:244 stop:351 length:108 start_codon:yes stop_codon:yes gene_type:complete
MMNTLNNWLYAIRRLLTAIWVLASDIRLAFIGANA